MTRTDYAAEAGRNIRYALRVLRRTPGVTAVAIGTLALGIGASTAIFTVVDSVLLRPLRFFEPQRLAVIRPTSGSRVSPEYLYEWRLQSRTFADLAGWRDVRANVTSGDPIEVLTDRATTNFFALLGTPAFLGRTFTTEKDLGHVEPEAVLSYGFWQRRYGGEAGVIGQPISLDGEVLTIVGVMPPGFTIRTNEHAESRAELWAPLRLTPGDRSAGMGGLLNVVGRLAPGATLDRTRAEIALIARRIEREHPSYTREWGVDVLPLHEATVKDVRLSLLVLFGGVGLLLLIACANVANLFLGRAAARRGEFAVRRSLGATRGRLVRQLLTESVVVAAIGGAAGMLLALWGTRLLVPVLPSGLELPRTAEIGMDARIFVFAILVTVATALLSGLIPSIDSARSASHAMLGQIARGAAGGRSSNRAGSLFIVSEVALAVVLLAGAGLLVRSFRELSRVDPGFGPERVLTLRMTLSPSVYEHDDRIRIFHADVLERLGNLPGVGAAGSANYLPLSNTGLGMFFEIEGRAIARADDQPGSWASTVGGRYFEAMGIPLLRGRLPGPADTERTPRVVIIDEELARRYWANEDPIGARVRWGREPGRSFTGEIVGVVGSVRWAALSGSPIATIYFWFPQNPGREISIAARVTGDPVEMAETIAAGIREIDPNQPVADIRPMDDYVAADLARPRLTMLLLGSFAAAALVLAAIGLYGVIAFAVAQRTREIGVRVALGAQGRDVLRLFLRQGIRLVGIGLAIGIAAALALGRVVSGLLYGIAPTDPATLFAVAAFLTAVSTLAAWLPARRALRIDPIAALKAE